MNREYLEELEIENADKISSFGSTSIIIDGEHIEYFDRYSLLMIVEYLIAKRVIFTLQYNMGDYVEEDYEDGVDSEDFEWEIDIINVKN